VLARANLLSGLAQRGAGSLVASSMDTGFRTATPSEYVIDVLPRLRETHCRAVPIVAGGQLRGLLTLETIGEYVMIESALRGVAPRSPARAQPATTQSFLKAG
jgi:hypothetical protein